MSSQPVSLDRPTAASFGGTQLLFAVVALGVATAAALLAGWAPLGFSIVTVFLFAGPHNWLEFRYFLTRLPARWGRLSLFFLLGFAGMFGLTAAFAALVYLTELGALSAAQYEYGFATLSSVLVLWIATLVH